MRLIREVLLALAEAALIVLLLWCIGAAAGVVVIGFRMVAG